jgi:hypothetical protein
MEADGANPRPCGTSVMSPADSASRAGDMPEASGDSSSGTFAEYMKFRIATAFVTMIGTSIIAFLCFSISRIQEHSFLHYFGGKPLPALTALFLSPAILPYLFPILFIIWGIGYIWRFRTDADHLLFLSVASILFSICFVILFAAAMCLPFVSLL